jgi:hypothetical protein
MLRFAALMLTLAMVTPLQAQWRSVVMLGAVHQRQTYWCEEVPHEYHAATPGIGIGYDLSDESMAAIGYWRNSHGNAAPFALIDWRPGRAGITSLGLFALVTSGYCRYNGGGLTPVAGLTLRVDVSRDAALHLLAIPPISERVAATLGVGISFSF